MLGADSRTAPARANADVAALIELASPRAYYLWSWLPTIFSTSN
jgi:hypothetical protein